MQRNSIDQYVGPSGGFNVATGGYVGISNKDMHLASQNSLMLYGKEGVDIRADGTNGNSSISGIATDGMFLSASGNMKIHCENGNLAVSSSGNITFGAIDNITAGTLGGAFTVNKVGLYQGLWGSAWTNYSSSILMATLGGGGSVFSSQGDAIFRSTLNDVHVDAQLGQVKLDAWASSGQMDYRFGPYEAWHVSPSHTASFFPIPHSGQVVQMIEEATPNLVGISGVGVTGSTVSGVRQYSSIYNSVSTIPAVPAGGAPSLIYNVNLPVKIRQDPIFNGTNPIKVLETGWYSLSYNINCENSTSIVRTIALLFGWNNTTAAVIPGSYSYAYCRINTGNAGKDTATVSSLKFYATAGDDIQVQIQRVAGNAAIDVLLNSSINLEFIGDWNG